MRATASLETLAVLRAGLPRRASLRLVSWAGQVCVLKDFAHETAWSRATWAALLSRREAAAYRRLDGVPGVARFVGRLPPDGLLVEHVEGRNCRDAKSERPAEDFFEELGGILARLRSRGVLHGDVKRNVLVSCGRPVLVDFAASFVVPQGLLQAAGPLVRLAARYDARAVAKLKALIRPDLLTQADQNRLRERLPFQSVVRRAQDVLQRTAGGRAREAFLPPPDYSQETS